MNEEDWALAIVLAELKDLKLKYAHQCRLNTTFVNQNALLIERNTALEKQLKERDPSV